MAEQAISVGHVDVGTAAVDVTDGLAAGHYEAIAADGAAGYYVGGAAAPSDPDDFWPLLTGGVIRFGAGGGSDPVWVRADPAARVVLRRLPGVGYPPLSRSRPHVAVSTTPVDLRGTLPAGLYRATGADVLVYVGATAPVDADDFWPEGENSWWTFCGAGSTATWARTRTGTGRLLVQEQ